MAKPRIFISSTYYDLRHVRERIEDFINTMGYETVLFESGDIPFLSDSPLDHSCYVEIESCHMLVLIIGGRYGSPASGEELPKKENQQNKFFEHYNSITKKEYETASAKDIPIFIFVDQGVIGEYQTFKKNRTSTSIKYAHVDSINIFLLLDEILGQTRNNFIKPFSKLDDIILWLREQWAGLFTDMLSRQRQQTEIANISSRLEELKAITDGLKKYSEEMLKDTLKQRGEQVILEEAKRLREVTLKRFAKSNLIRYVIRSTRKKSGIKAEDAYSAMEESNSFRDFLQRTMAHQSTADRLVESPGANRDYISLKTDYFDVDLAEFSIDDLGLPAPIIRILTQVGISTVSELKTAKLTDIPGIGKSRARDIKIALHRIERSM